IHQPLNYYTWKTMAILPCLLHKRIFDVEEYHLRVSHPALSALPSLTPSLGLERHVLKSRMRPFLDGVGQMKKRRAPPLNNQVNGTYLLAILPKGFLIHHKSQSSSGSQVSPNSHVPVNQL